MPGDIKGMKIRPADATIANFVTLLGGTNVQSSAPEVRDIMERHVADAVTFPWGSLVLFGIDKVTKYHMDAPLYVTTFAFVFNKDKYNQMSRSPEEGDRRQLQHRSGRPRRRAVGQVRGRRHRQGEGRAGPGGLQAHARANSPSGRKRPSRWSRPGPTASRKSASIRIAAMKELRADLAKYNALAK